MRRACVRPGCHRPAEAVMSYDYGRRAVWIAAIAGEVSPQTYVLCGACAESMAPPRGWVLTDERDRQLFEVVG